MTKEELAKKNGLSKKSSDILTPSEKLVTTIEQPKVIKEVRAKNPVGKPKKRRPGDKQMSFWLDADLVDLLYKQLSYGDTAGEYINSVLREHLTGERK